MKHTSEPPGGRLQGRHDTGMRSAPARELCNRTLSAGSANPHGCCIGRRSHHIGFHGMGSLFRIGWLAMDGIDGSRSMGLPFSLCIQIVVVVNAVPFLWITAKSALVSSGYCMQNPPNSMCPPVDESTCPIHDLSTGPPVVPAPSTGQPQTANRLSR